MSISGDGTTVAFTDPGTGFVSGASTDGYNDQMYVWSAVNNQAVTGLTAGQIQLVSHQAGSNLTGASINSNEFPVRFHRGRSRQPEHNGNAIAYYDAGSNLVSGTKRDRQCPQCLPLSGIVELQYSRHLRRRQSNEAGNNPPNQVASYGVGPAEASGPQISADGTIVAYANNSSNLIAGMSNPDGYDNVYSYSSLTGQNTLISHAAGSTNTMDTYGGTAPNMSSDGKYISFLDYAVPAVGNVSSGDINSSVNVRLYNSQSSSTVQPSIVGIAFDSGTPWLDFAGSLAPTVLNANSSVGPVVAWDGLALASDNVPGIANSSTNFNVFESVPSTTPTPQISSSTTTTFSYGTPGTYSITTIGFTPTSYSESGTLPTGVTFNTNTGVLSGPPTQSGSFTLLLTATNGSVSPTMSLTLIVNQAPTFTSSTTTLFTVGTPGNFTVTTTAYPAPTLTESGALPPGVTFAGGILSGTPTQPGTWNLLFTSTNSVGTTLQSFTMTVNQPPAITSPNTTTFVTGVPNSFTMTTTGYPTNSLTESGTLPSGMTFIDNGNDTATLSGTPTAGQSGTYVLDLTASNGAGTNATQTFNLVIDQPPAITSSPTTTFTTGTPGTFTITTTGYPTASLSEGTTLPAGLSFTDNGNGTATLNGTPAAGDAGSYAFTISASNSVGSTATQSFNLVINQAPAFTSSAATTFNQGIAGAVSITTTGYPSATLSESGALPAGVTFVSNGDGTATLSGTPSASGTYPLILTASNSVGNSATQNYTLTVSNEDKSGFGVTAATASGSELVLTFNAPVDPGTTALYSSPGDTTIGPPDVIVTGSNGMPLRGSLVVDPTNPDIATFVQTSGALAPDTYTVTVTSAVQEVGGTPSGGYSSTVTVPVTTGPVVSVPSFARGPGQAVQLADSLGNQTGIPISISNANDVTQVAFSLTYDPTLLTIASSGALTLSSAAEQAGIDTVTYSISNVDANHSVLTVTLTSSGAAGDSGLTTTSSVPLVTIAASVPTTALYLDSAVLNVQNVVVNAPANGDAGADSTGTSSVAGIGVAGVEAVAYLGNVSGSGTLGALDASLVDQVGSGAGSGFSAFKDIDPSIIGGVSGGLTVGALDASLINEAGAGANVPQIPQIPVNVVPTFEAPDPYLYLSSVQASPGQTVTETVYLDVTDPNGVQLSAIDEAIGFDAGALQISNVRSASGLQSLGSYATASTADNQSGVLLVGQAFAGTGLPPVLPYGTDIPVLQFDVTLNSNAAVGAVTDLTLLQDGTVNGRTKFTAISDNEGPLTWTTGFAPSNSGNPAIDGSVTAVTPSSEEAAPIVSAPSSPVVTQPKVIQPVRRVTPVPVSQPVAVTPTPAPSVSLVLTIVNAEVATSVVTNVSAVVSVTEEISQQSVTFVVNVTIPVSPSEILQGANGSFNPTRSADAGASLSLAVQGTSRTPAVASTGTSNAKASTSALDEVYSQAISSRLNGLVAGVTDDDTTDEWFDLWNMDLVDPEIKP